MREYPDPQDGETPEIVPKESSTTGESAPDQGSTDRKTAAERRRQKILNRGEDRLGRLTKTFRGEEVSPRSPEEIAEANKKVESVLEPAQHFPEPKLHHRRVGDSLTGDVDLDRPPASNIGDLMPTRPYSPNRSPSPGQPAETPQDPLVQMMNMFASGQAPQGMEEMMQMFGGGMFGNLLQNMAQSGQAGAGLQSGAATSGLAGLAGLATAAGGQGGGPPQDPLAGLQAMLTGGDPREKARLEKLKQYQQFEEKRARPWRRIGALFSIMFAIATLWMLTSSANVVHVPLSTDPASTGWGIRDWITAKDTVVTDDDEIGAYDTTLARLRGMTSGQTQVLDDLGMERYGYPLWIIFLASQITLHVLRLSTMSVMSSTEKRPPNPPIPTSANNPIINHIVGWMERNSLTIRMFRDDVAWYVFTIGVGILLSWLVPL